MKLILKIVFLNFMVLLTTVAYAGDLFEIKKSDSNIKPLVFPLSMVVIENRPSKDFYFPIETNASPVPENRGWNLSDIKLIKKTLGATDPARIAPTRMGLSFNGVIDKENLKELEKNNSERIIFIFRREIYLSGKREFESEKTETESLISQEPPYQLKIRTKGLLYLTKQNKILLLPPNVKESNLNGEDTEKRIKKLNLSGLNELANEAKIVLNKNKYEKRRSNY